MQMHVDDKDKFLKENCGLIKKVAHKYFFETSKFSFEDLVQLGNQVAIRAIDAFDKNKKKAKLTTYVTSAVDNEIGEFVRKNKHDIYVTSYTQNQHYQAKQRGDTDEEYSGPNNPMAIRLDYEYDDKKSSNKTCSISNVLPSGSPPPEQKMIVEEQKEILMRAIKSLPERERNVVVGHHLNNQTFVELGAEMGVTKQRVQQIEAKAMAKLKDRLEPRIGEFIARADGLARR